MRQRIAAYGTWASPLDLKRMFEQPSAPMYPCAYRGRIYWIEARAQESGRLVLVRREHDGGETCLTPAGFSIRTRMHEYGGRCFAFAQDCVYFSNDVDQRIYRQRLEPGAVPTPVTPARLAGARAMYADFTVARDESVLVFACERERAGRENENGIACLQLAAADTVVQEPVILACGHDFYANPVLAPGGERLAWMQWDHPDMPWDSSAVAVAGLARNSDGRVSCAPPQVIAGGAGRAVGHLSFGADGELYFVMDGGDAADPPANFWNLHVYDARGLRRVTHDLAEYGLPHWVFGESRYVCVDARTLVAVRTTAAGDELVRIDIASGTSERLAPEFSAFSQLARMDDGGGAAQLLCVAAAPTATARLVLLDGMDGSYRTIKEGAILLAPEDISVASAQCYPTAGGGAAHAWFYPPVNGRYAPPADTLPPLIVMVHGGPTGRADNALAYARQYWTTRGFAVLDVNHRGSSGYGRAYRQALRGLWGELDTSDIADGVRYLVAAHRVHPGQVCIRGGSAGGYAVLRALTEYPELFAAGACYYGIGNLATLAETTHKFEAHYLDGLLGAPYTRAAKDPTSVYYRRSPIHHLDSLRSPMILFQGLDDKVVPPVVSQEVVRGLAAKGIAHEYVEYAGEGHGFRRAETRIDALRREAAFYARALGLV